jgi:hypothetical protein
MTARRPLTARERELLAAITELLDLPKPAGYETMLTRNDTMKTRVYQMLGCFNVVADDPGATIDPILRTLRHFAAEPLGYEPKITEEAADMELPA